MKIAMALSTALFAIFVSFAYAEKSVNCGLVTSNVVFCEVGSRLAQSQSDRLAVEQFCGELAVALDAEVCYGSVQTHSLVGLEPSVAVFELSIERTGSSSLGVGFSVGSSADWLSQREARLIGLTHSVLDADLSVSMLRPLSTVFQRWDAKP